MLQGEHENYKFIDPELLTQRLWFIKPTPRRHWYTYIKITIETLDFFYWCGTFFRMEMEDWIFLQSEEFPSGKCPAISQRLQKKIMEKCTGSVFVFHLQWENWIQVLSCSYCLCLMDKGKHEWQKDNTFKNCKSKLLIFTFLAWGTISYFFWKLIICQTARQRPELGFMRLT